jgi:phospholipid-binding lipoprotein MlaA
MFDIDLHQCQADTIPGLTHAKLAIRFTRAMQSGNEAMSHLPRLLRMLAAIALAAPVLAYPERTWAVSDPLEPFNRAMFRFNDAVLDNLIYPLGGLAQTWVTPHARQAATNVYNNLSETEFIITNLLQGNFTDARVALERFAVNSTVGLAGLYDPATSWGLVTREPEFSEAVCSLGIPSGAYLVAPLVGPTNVNAAAALAGLYVGHLYVLALVSSTLVTIDIVVDATVGTAMLRHSVDPVDPVSTDPYNVQRYQYAEYIETACAAHPTLHSGGW